jgi:hypothetical protein
VFLMVPSFKLVFDALLSPPAATATGTN